MNEEEIKTLRHSFTSKEDGSKISKNQFGHTVLGTMRDMDISNIEVKLNEFGEVSAEPMQSLLDSPELLNLAGFVRKKEDPYIEPVVSEPKQSFSNVNVKINDLISSLDLMDGTNESPNIHPATFVHVNPFLQNQQDTGTTAEKKSQINHMKGCSNQECLYALPVDAKFCLKCGTAQLPKFCTECGFKFPGLEKFCPDCGMKR